jgi:uncharacterized protein with HEPN domain
MPREYRQQIDDILGSISYIKEYIIGMSFDDFAGDRKTQDAVIRNLEIIGEAARALPDEIKQKSNIQWYKIVAFRNILIHEYFGVNLKLVWDVVENKLEELETECKALL